MGKKINRHSFFSNDLKLCTGIEPLMSNSLAFYFAHASGRILVAVYPVH